MTKYITKSYVHKSKNEIDKYTQMHKYIEDNDVLFNIDMRAMGYTNTTIPMALKTYGLKHNLIFKKLDGISWEKSKKKT